MRCLLRLGAGAFLLAAAVLLRPASAADDTHPLDPDATPGVLPTDDPFQGYVPLLDRDAPAPSFVTAPAVDGEAFAAEAAGGETPATPAMRHAVTGGPVGRETHGAHTTALTAE